MSVILSMGGHIDATFKSVPAFRFRESGGAYVDGFWVDGIDAESEHDVNIQPLSDKELGNVQSTIGAERILDSRRVYVNDGNLYKISPSDHWQFDDIEGRFKTFKLDNRPWDKYCKIIVIRIDDEPKV